jgi:hypothetical protein
MAPPEPELGNPPELLPQATIIIPQANQAKQRGATARRVAIRTIKVPRKRFTSGSLTF